MAEEIVRKVDHFFVPLGDAARGHEFLSDTLGLECLSTSLRELEGLAIRLVAGR